MALGFLRKNKNVKEQKTPEGLDTLLNLLYMELEQSRKFKKMFNKKFNLSDIMWTTRGIMEPAMGMTGRTEKDLDQCLHFLFQKGYIEANMPIEQGGSVRLTLSGMKFIEKRLGKE